MIEKNGGHFQIQRLKIHRNTCVTVLIIYLVPSSSSQNPLFLIVWAHRTWKNPFPGKNWTLRKIGWWQKKTKVIFKLSRSKYIRISVLHTEKMLGPVFFVAQWIQGSKVYQCFFFTYYFNFGGKGGHRILRSVENHWAQSIWPIN